MLPLLKKALFVTTLLLTFSTVHADTNESSNVARRDFGGGGGEGGGGGGGGGGGRFNGGEGGGGRFNDNGNFQHPGMRYGAAYNRGEENANEQNAWGGAVVPDYTVNTGDYSNSGGGQNQSSSNNQGNNNNGQGGSYQGQYQQNNYQPSMTPYQRYQYDQNEQNLWNQNPNAPTPTQFYPSSQNQQRVNQDVNYDSDSL